MKISHWIGTAALLSALGGCVGAGVSPSQGAPAASPDLANACIQELRTITNNPGAEITVLGSDPRGALRDYTLEINGTGVWSCQIDATGTPVSVDLLSSDGSSLV